MDEEKKDEKKRATAKFCITDKGTPSLRTDCPFPPVVEGLQSATICH